jgi:outer membrane receptor for ferrienterochelin and colicins
MGVDVSASSKVSTLAGNKADDFILTHLTFSYVCPHHDNAEISASVRNLFDVDYGYPGSGEHTEDVIHQDGQSFWLRLMYTFKND